MSQPLTCALVGLPNVGKSTLFNALTRKQAPSANYPFCTIDPNIGVVEVRDERLVHLAEQSKSKKIVPALVSFVDVAGLVKGASHGEGLGNQFLSHIRESDAIAHIVRCFEGEKVIHVAGRIDPLDDIAVIQIELILADLQMGENILGRLEKQAKGKKELLPSLEVLKKSLTHLNQNLPLSQLSLVTGEEKLLASYPFLTRKKMLYVCNVSEEDFPSLINPHVERVQTLAALQQSTALPICARFEEELSQLDEKEALEFLQSVGLHEAGLHRLIRATFSLLNLITFITTGEIETKAWTLRKGATAAEAAGKIHSDIERGFIRAEVVSYHDMIHYGGRSGARDAGKARSEGRDYVVQDGDVILYYHHG